MRRSGGCAFPYRISRSAIRTASRKPVTALTPVLNPHGVLSLKPSDDGSASNSVHDTNLEQSFIRGSGHGLLYLGANAVGTSLPPVLAYWREFASRYVTALCNLPDVAEGKSKSHVPVPADDALELHAPHLFAGVRKTELAEGNPVFGGPAGRSRARRVRAARTRARSPPRRLRCRACGCPAGSIRK